MLIPPLLGPVLVPRPGGDASPGGGPLAVAKGWLEEVPIPPKPSIGPCGDIGAAGTIPPGCPVRTPRGFFEKLRRIPPLTLLWSGCPYSSLSAFVANETQALVAPLLGEHRLEFILGSVNR